MTDQNKSVENFFNKIADNYDAKYESRKNRFLAHFFRRRIEIAMDDLPKSLGTVLDIGAGTGQLYQFLLENGFAVDNYVAVDVSEGMLAQSSIPNDSRHVGTVHLPTLDRYEGNVDYFFLLGVTTYMKPKQLAAVLDRIAQLSGEDGMLVCTFTNRNSIEFLAQSAITSLLKRFKNLTGQQLDMVAAQTFPRLIISETEMTDFLRPHGTIERVDYLNHTLTPFNRLFPVASIYIESFLSRILRKRPGALALLSSDIIFKVRLGR